MAELNENFEFEQDGKTYSLYDLPAGFVIKGDVDLSGKGLTELPDLSDVVVEGNFNCDNNQLTTLEGAPQKIGRNFSCSDNQLTTLEGAPQKVDGRFWCNNNQLTSLKDAPQKVSGDFYCYNNQLTTLDGAPKEVSGNFYCYNNQLTSLEGAPKEVSGNFYCFNNKLTTLDGAPQKVGGDFYCHKNQLTTLEGAPKEVSGNFYCYNNQLTSLFKLPQMKEDERIYCDNALGQEYGFSDSSNSGINSGDLFKSSRYQNEVKIDELRQKKHQEDIEKRETVRKNTQAAFDAWLKQNGKNSPEK